jgi:hypothetical protein
MLQLTIHFRKSHRQPQCTLQLVCEDRALFAWTDLRVSLCGQQHRKCVRASNSSGTSTFFFFCVNFALHPTPQTKPNGVVAGDTKQLCLGNIPANFICSLTMTHTIISQNIDLSFWIIVHNKQPITSRWHPNSAVLACVLALDRNVPDRRKPTPLQQHRSLNSLQYWSHASFRPHFPAPYGIHADPRPCLWCAVKPQTKHRSVCESKQTYSIFTPAFTLCLFLPVFLFHSLPSFPCWYLFLWSVL